MPSIVIVPPREIFQIEPQPRNERLAVGTYSIPNYDKIIRSKTGGMLSIYSGHPLPRKGFPYDEATISNSKVKRVTLALFTPLLQKAAVPMLIAFGLTPFKWKIKFVESFLQNYIRLADSIYTDCVRIPYLKYEYYCECSKALWHLTTHSLFQLGISFPIADNMGKIVATMFEVDDAYRLIIQDLATETTKQTLLKQPIKEIKRLLEIYKTRDERFGDDTAIGNKFINFGTALTYLLLIPKIRKAFKHALGQIEFDYLQYDEYDDYWNLGRSDYKVRGRPVEERISEMQRRIDEYALQQQRTQVSPVAEDTGA